jgi:hypothetical protein
MLSRAVEAEKSPQLISISQLDDCHLSLSSIKEERNPFLLPSSALGLLLPTSGLRPPFLGRAAGALRSIDRTNRQVGAHR